jgi:hypothetical protein
MSKFAHLYETCIAMLVMEEVQWKKPISSFGKENGGNGKVWKE